MSTKKSPKKPNQNPPRAKNCKNYNNWLLPTCIALVALLGLRCIMLEVNNGRLSRTSIEAVEHESFAYLLRKYVAQCPMLEPRGPVSPEQDWDRTKTNACELLDYTLNENGELELNFRYEPWDNQTWELSGEVKQAKLVFHKENVELNGHAEYREELITEQ